MISPRYGGKEKLPRPLTNMKETENRLQKEIDGLTEKVEKYEKEM